MKYDALGTAVTIEDQEQLEAYGLLSASFDGELTTVQRMWPLELVCRKGAAHVATDKPVR